MVENELEEETLASTGSEVQIELQFQTDVEGPETSKNPTQSFIHNIISNDCVRFSDVSGSSTLQSF